MKISTLTSISSLHTDKQPRTTLQTVRVHRRITFFWIRHPIGYFLCSPDQWNNSTRHLSHSVMKRTLMNTGWAKAGKLFLMDWIQFRLGGWCKLAQDKACIFAILAAISCFSALLVFTHVCPHSYWWAYYAKPNLQNLLIIQLQLAKEKSSFGVLPMNIQQFVLD